MELMTDTGRVVEGGGWWVERGGEVEGGERWREGEGVDDECGKRRGGREGCGEWKVEEKDVGGEG